MDCHGFSNGTGRDSLKTILYDQPERVGRWVCSKTGGTYTKDDSTAIGLEDDGELIWGAYYNMFNTQSVAIHFSSEQGRRLNYAFIKAAGINLSVHMRRT